MSNITRKTTCSIDGTDFKINGTLTYEGITHEQDSIEGLLLNSRMIQALFDDENPDTVDYWKYPDTGKWDPERNVNEFVQAMYQWYEKGLRAVVVCFQGGNPAGYAGEQPWRVTGFREDGSLKEDWLDRLELVLETADQLGMVVNLGYFYFGQDQVLADEDAVIKAAQNLTEWLLDKEFRNVLIEVNNECNVPKYDHDILEPDRVHELIELIQGIEKDGFRYPVSTSFRGGTIPTDAVIETSDYILMHGNGVDRSERIAEMIEEVRNRDVYDPKPIVFNEDDHYNFLTPRNNMHKAISNGASWGFLDNGRSDYEHGYQSPPVNWGINTERKQQFFDYVEYITSPDTP